MIPTLERQITPSGLLLRSDHFLLFFGNRESQTDQCRTEFPNLTFTRLKQVHGDQIVRPGKTEDRVFEADAQISDMDDHALVVVTADCAPLLIGDTKSGRIASVHAGWRGVASQILCKTLQKMLSLGSHQDDLFVALGPHIGVQSFEVHLDVCDQLLRSAGPSVTNAPLIMTASEPEKRRVDLSGILKSQWQSMGLQKSQFFCFQTDTFDSPDYHSFRRDGPQAGRQISWIAHIGHSP